MAENRKAHVKRIWKKDENDEPDESIWIDVLRLDSFKIRYRGLEDGKTSLSVRYRLKWKDDENDDGKEDGNPSRKTTKLEIKEPPDDEEKLLDLFIIKKAKITMKGGVQPGDESGATWQKVVWAFKNSTEADQKSKTRKLTIVKVVNNDLKDLDMGEPGSARNVPWDEYKQALKDGEKTEGQYLNVEHVDKFMLKFGVTAPKPYRNQRIKHVWKNKELKELFEVLGNEETELKKPPVRTDPFQFIVNVGLGGAVEFFPGKE